MFPETLRALRLEIKQTQSDMAKALNISRVAYTNYELGNREPDFATMSRIARLFGVSVDYLLGNTPVREPAHLAAMGIQSARPDISPQMRHIFLQAATLQPDALAELQKYIDYLKSRVGSRADNTRKFRPGI